LGLAIVYQILQAHDAKISVTSALGKGTEFQIRLKTAVDDAVDSQPALAMKAGGARG